jgi:hypothetical protein
LHGEPLGKFEKRLAIRGIFDPPERLYKAEAFFDLAVGIVGFLGRLIRHDIGLAKLSSNASRLVLNKTVRQ